MRNKTAGQKKPKPQGAIVNPNPGPRRKHPPKNNLAEAVKLLRALGPNFYVPGRPLPHPRRPDSQPTSRPPQPPTMKKTVRGKKPQGAIVNPNPGPRRKRPPKNNMGDVAKLFRALGPNFYVPGRPIPKPRRPDSVQP